MEGIGTSNWFGFRQFIWKGICGQIEKLEIDNAIVSIFRAIDDYSEFVDLQINNEVKINAFINEFLKYTDTAESALEDTLKVTCDGDNNLMDLLDKMETVKNHFVENNENYFGYLANDHLEG